MALPRALSFLRQGTGNQVLEIYADPICFYSTKMAKSVVANVFPLMEKGGKYEGKLSVITRLYPQPVMYTTSFPIEALLVFGSMYPTQFMKYFFAIGEIQTEFWNNEKNMSRSPLQARDSLIELALKVLDGNGQLTGPRSKTFADFRDKLENRPPYGMNEAYSNLRYSIKIGRQNGVHVTPTVLFDGLIEESCSSSWGKDEWEKFLEEKMQ